MNPIKTVNCKFVNKIYWQATPPPEKIMVAPDLGVHRCDSRISYHTNKN
jgi:hypothetical protein